MIEKRRAIAILNPNTGRLPADKVLWLVDRILSSKFDIEYRESKYAGHERELAQQAATETDLVIAIGGDGTVGHVASGLIDTDTALAIIPTGSTNVIARGLRIPGDPFRAARALRNDVTERWIDVADCDGRAILHMAGTGLDSLMFRDTPPRLKRFLAWAAYIPPAVKHLSSRPWEYQITIDGTPIETDARMVLIANGGFVIHPWFKVGEDIKIDDGLLDVCIFSPPSVFGSLTLALWITIGKVKRSRHFSQIKGTTVRITSTPPAPVEFDGDYIGTTPFEVSLRSHALPILIPRDNKK